MEKIKISIIIPVFNEAKNINFLIKELKAVLKNIKQKIEIIFVDDGSTDETFNCLEKIKEIEIIQLRKNYGQSSALDAGIKNAKGDILVTLDGDGQNDPSDIPKLLKELKNYDCVCGWRKQRKDSFGKKFISQGAAYLGGILVNPGIHDSGCTLRAYKKECFEDLNLYGEMHRMIPALLKWRGFSLTEIKVNHRLRKFGSSKYTWKRIIKGFLDMINVWFWRKYENRPMHLFGSAGLVLVALGTLLLIYLAFARLFWGYPLSDKIWPLVGFFSIMTGIQFFVFGLLAGIIVQNQNKKDFYLIKKIIER